VTMASPHVAWAYSLKYTASGSWAAGRRMGWASILATSRGTVDQESGRLLDRWRPRRYRHHKRQQGGLLLQKLRTRQCGASCKETIAPSNCSSTARSTAAPLPRLTLGGSTIQGSRISAASRPSVQYSAGGAENRRSRRSPVVLRFSTSQYARSN
jgi:hypothetical protein